MRILPIISLVFLVISLVLIILYKINKKSTALGDIGKLIFYIATVLIAVEQLKKWNILI